MSAKRIDMNVLAPDAGLVTRFPSNQAGRTGRALVTASNVRAKAGRIYNAPGHQPLLGVPSDLSPFNFLQMMQLEGVNTLIAGNETNLYAVSPVVAEGSLYVNAGPNQTLPTTTSYIMEGFVGGPVGDTLMIGWTVLSGPGTVTFGDISSPTSSISVSEYGTYEFRLSATDGRLSKSDEVSLSFVSPPPPQVSNGLINAAPSDPISFQIIASNSPVSYEASDLPSGFNIDAGTGVITGTMPANPETYYIPITATNSGGTGTGLLTIVPSTSPDFSFCSNPAQNWPDTTSGIPYVNSGNTIDGLSADLLNGGSPGVLTTDGTIITITQPIGILSIFTTPATVVGDFTFSYDVMLSIDLAYSIEMLLLDEDNKKAYRFLAGAASPEDIYLELDSYCSIVPDENSGGYQVLTHNEAPAFSAGNWYTMTLTRRGTLLTLTTSAGGSNVFESTSAVGFKIALSCTNDGVIFYIRNISITQP